MKEIIGISGRTQSTMKGFAGRNGKYISVWSYEFYDVALISSDGINWSECSFPALYQRISVTFDNGLFVAVANMGTGNVVMTSPDGEDWTICNDDNNAIISNKPSANLTDNPLPNIGLDEFSEERVKNLPKDWWK